VSIEEIRKLIDLLESVDQHQVLGESIWPSAEKRTAKELKRDEAKRRKLTPTVDEQAQDLLPAVKKAFNYVVNGGNRPDGVYIRIEENKKISFKLSGDYITSYATPFNILLCTKRNNMLGWDADNNKLYLFEYKNIGTSKTPIFIPHTRYVDFKFPGEYNPQLPGDVKKASAILKTLCDSPEYKDFTKYYTYFS